MLNTGLRREKQEFGQRRLCRNVRRRGRSAEEQEFVDAGILRSLQAGKIDTGRECGGIEDVTMFSGG